ncbi:putative Metalloprotease [Vibrio nigripulchritudo SFn27]|uniref:Putative Metalloprotease n=1 Tax=Vibrio nigripulchritudo TaxID=28173 RepID=U4K3X8_9VIBR|nr:zinc-dependent metalloprotease [Vibrio nigripulchritudo]CCN83661.1 putative Metalloprotease [Vibrio nigripulchritudo BLFn1]CCN87334.1 putative Metalloprotease [Vibrio nigripulchritudo SFn27]CCN94713.1 putative Metalloprotease [Vibrio nigripulchritudo ENn2]CCO40746.1 putative Metalloprotease [Vibrio nigripulchritudo SFn135]CCO54823.1 putative Metalloprotease [Vibrio nigripulchritudo Wn13]
MKFKKLSLVTAVSAALVGCGADDQAYDTLSKPEQQFAKSNIKTDQVYLYMPSMAKAPRYAVSMAPFMQGQEKLVTLSFEAALDNSKSGGLKVRMLSPDIISQEEIDQGKLARWLENPTDAHPVLTIPGEFVDYQCKEDSYGDCTNKEEKVDNNEIPWNERSYFLPEFENVTVHENTWNDLFTFANGCYTKSGSARLADDANSDWNGYEIAEDGSINFEVEQDYKVANNWRCIINGLVQSDFDMSNLSFTVSQFYSLVPLDVVRSSSDEYEPIIYQRGDEDTYGFFASEQGRPDPSYVGGDFDQKFNYLHRFNPNLPALEYHLSDSFNLNDETLFFKRVTQEVVDRMNPQLEKVGVPQIKLIEPSGKQSGDLRYNVINLIDEPLENGLAGYGPSAVNPLTGEIVHAHVNQYSGVLRSISDWLWDRIVADYNKGRVVEVSSPATEGEQPANSETTNTTASASIEVETNSISLEEKREEFKVENLTKHSESVQDLVLALQDEMSSQEEDLTLGQHSALTALERRLWAENNMYPVSAMRAGTTLKNLPTSIGGITFDYQDPALWVDAESTPENIGKAGKLKEWAQLTEKQQEDISLFIVGVFYAKTLVHEFGHNLGLRHNFKGSNDHANYFNADELSAHGIRTVPGYSSIMDYNPSLLNALPVFGPYDLAALRFGYKRQVEGTITSVSGNEDEVKSAYDIDGSFINLHKLDTQLRNEMLDPYSQPSTLVYDGVIKALDSDNNFTASLREYAYCTDGNVSLNDDCNRHDEGRTRDEIMDFKMESYDDLYYKRTVRGSRANFSESTIVNYSMRRVSEFMDWRNSLQVFDRFQGIFEFDNVEMMGLPVADAEFCSIPGAIDVWFYPIVCGAPTAVDTARDKLVDILLTPDHTCEITDQNGVVSYKKLAEMMDVFEARGAFPINHVPTSCYDQYLATTLQPNETITGELGKFLNSGSAPRPAPVNNFSNYIDYVGHWPDKLAAAATLVNRVGFRRTTDRSTKSLLELPEVTDYVNKKYIHVNKGEQLLDTLILGSDALSLKFQNSEGRFHSPSEDFSAITWEDKIEAMPYYGSYSIRLYFGLPRYGEIPLNKAILNTMVLHSAGVMVDQRDEVLARSITLRSELPGAASVREYKRTNGRTYYAAEENTYAWKMIEFVKEFDALEDARVQGVDYSTLALNQITVADYQDESKRAGLAKAYAYQKQSLENLPVYNNLLELRLDILTH